VRIHIKGVGNIADFLSERRRRSLTPLPTKPEPMLIRRYNSPTGRTRAKARQGRKERIVERSPSRM
jgi:hypothetical protein